MASNEAPSPGSHAYSLLPREPQTQDASTSHLLSSQSGTDLEEDEEAIMDTLSYDNDLHGKNVNADIIEDPLSDRFSLHGAPLSSETGGSADDLLGRGSTVAERRGGDRIAFYATLVSKYRT